ncbi:nucleoside kinase [Clostridium sp. AM46-21]|uniref:uridine kinase family protein n=1 Tax=Clostridium sp. AM46-21 TaxID=2293033 RepID=UPI000E54405A|nr:nucleoside kinase [Clostridium sp. AM46-21]RHS51599.1 nucleoside kinase [Clostridium sp. AM46-21]
MSEKAVHNSVLTLKELAKKWAVRVGADSVEKINEIVEAGKGTELILVCEAMQQNAIYDIARSIRREKKRIVMIAGPSSAGKTTFSHRLSIQLCALGLHPHPIAVDNYFINREDNPKDENGNYNFECLEALDVELLNHDMNQLLCGQTVELPEFDFMNGRRLYKGDNLRIGTQDVLILEGIHSLNPKMSYALSDEDKYKIYISPLNQLMIGSEDKISTLDSRLIRRIVRDNRTRGHDIERTLSMWQSVRQGEEQYIFPYEDNADVMFNSGLLYEYSVLKKHIEPRLMAVEETSPYYSDVLRLKELTDRFLPLEETVVPLNSILREFIGGGCFKV